MLNRIIATVLSVPVILVEWYSNLNSTRRMWVWMFSIALLALSTIGILAIKDHKSWELYRVEQECIRTGDIRVRPNITMSDGQGGFNSFPQSPLVQWECKNGEILWR